MLLKQPPRILLSGLAAGALSVLAYGLVLWAQTRGALAPIAALRETSVIFGAIIGSLAFREPFGRTRVLAAVIVESPASCCSNLGDEADLVQGISVRPRRPVIPARKWFPGRSTCVELT